MSSRIFFLYVEALYAYYAVYAGRTTFTIRKSADEHHVALFVGIVINLCLSLSHPTPLSHITVRRWCFFLRVAFCCCCCCRGCAVALSYYFKRKRYVEWAMGLHFAVTTWNWVMFSGTISMPERVWYLALRVYKAHSTLYIYGVDMWHIIVEILFEIGIHPTYSSFLIRTHGGSIVFALSQWNVLFVTVLWICVTRSVRE